MHFGINCVKFLDTTSKVGTKHAVIKADRMAYLGQFGNQINEAQFLISRC